MSKRSLAARHHRARRPGTGTPSASAAVRPCRCRAASSSCSWPRATVPATSGRADRAVGEERRLAQRLVLRLVVHVLAAAAAASQQSADAPSDRDAVSSRWPCERSVRNGGHLPRLRASRGSVASPRGRTSDRVASMHRKNRSRLASAKRGTLNTGWYGCGSPFSASMPSTADERRAENRALERDRDERRPAVQRPAADVERIVDRRRPVLQRDSRRRRRAGRRSARSAAAACRCDAERLGQLLDRERRVGVHAAVARVVRAVAPPRPARSGRRTRPSGRRCGGSRAHRQCSVLRPSPPAASSASRRSRSSAGSG